jgi:sugar-phosphatase
MIFQARGLLFDNDGVLVDSAASVHGSWGEWAKKYAPEFVLDYSHHGRPARDIVRSLVSEDLFETAYAEINQLELDLTHLTKPMPGAVELTGSLAPGTWTIVTSAGPALAKGRLSAAGIPIPAELVTAHDIVNGKPNPDPYLKGAENLGLSAWDSIVFEDAPSGVKSGVAAGARVIGIGKEVLESAAEIVVHDLTGISFENNQLTIPDSNRLR